MLSNDVKRPSIDDIREEEAGELARESADEGLFFLARSLRYSTAAN